MASRVVRLTLAIWVCIASTLIEVSHRHDAMNGDNRLTVDALASYRFHKHIVILGVPSGEIPCPEPTDDALPSDNFAIGFDCVSTSFVMDSSHATSTTTTTTTTIFWVSPEISLLFSGLKSLQSKSKPITSTLCTLATHSRTGVLRV